MKLIPSIAAAVAASISLLNVANAGPLATRLEQCLVESTSQRDRQVLARWFFLSMAQHPSVSKLSNASQKDIDDTSRAVASLFTRLTTQDCLTETKAALQQEGPSSIESAYDSLSKIAGQEITSGPESRKVLEGFLKYIDQKKFGVISENSTPR